MIENRSNPGVLGALNQQQSTTGESAKRKRVVLVDPQILVRDAITSLINGLNGFEIVGCAANGDEVFERIDALKPDLVVTEIALPGRSGIELLYEMRRRGVKVRILVLSQVDAPDMIRQALLAGAQGYVLKSGPLEELEEGLNNAFSGRKYLPQRIAHLAQVPENSFELSSGRPHDPLNPLSPREREIFHLLASGLQNNVIAKKLCISPRTVETHRARVVRKLKLTSNGELIRFAIKHGLTLV